MNVFHGTLWHPPSVESAYIAKYVLAFPPVELLFTLHNEDHYSAAAAAAAAAAADVVGDVVAYALYYYEQQSVST